MFPETIDENSRNNLMILKKENLLKDFYLAGGTAVALHLGHRISYDLDFFSNKNFDGLLLKQIVSNLGDYRDALSNKNNLIGIFNGTKLSFIHYKPVLIGVPELLDEVTIASIKDLSAMKVEAISQRGAKRDFIDLFCIMQKNNASITDVISQYIEKYKDFNPTIIHILKSIRYFDDAEKDIMPTMKIPIQWQDVKHFFKNQEVEIVKLLDGIGINKKDKAPDSGLEM
jgi:hypothetical protein